ncbi:uncharacterized protein TNCV_3906691 [Trichonephila clavipes]|nr:uncharacterized protein TNCV_3906691 [Trichonephila clavipes]
MKFDRDGRRTYRNCDNCLDTELTPAHIFDCPAILAALQEQTNLYVNNIEHIARTVIWAHEYQSSIDDQGIFKMPHNDNDMWDYDVRFQKVYRLQSGPNP